MFYLMLNIYFAPLKLNYLLLINRFPLEVCINCNLEYIFFHLGHESNIILEWYLAVIVSKNLHNVILDFRVI